MSMNCLDFRRRLLVDPNDRDIEITQHATACAPCCAYARRQARFEQSLHAAVKTEVPECLAARIVLQQCHSQARIVRATRLRWLAAAASVLLTVGVTGAFIALRQLDSLPRAVLAHIYTERFALDARERLDVARINEVVRPVRTRVDSALGAVSYANLCDLDGVKVAHLVLEGAKGPVTVLVMPDKSIKGRVAVDDDRYEGEIIPSVVGSVAIVGQRGESLGKIEARVHSGITHL